jgi:copper homeostasis protein
LNTHARILLEVCIASVGDAVTASSGGADRLELNFGMELGGLTPSIGLLEEVKREVKIPVVAMVRPRAGGFCYTRAELRLMLRDAELLLDAGADGIVSGALRYDGTLDGGFWQSMRRLAKDRQLVFHRALDVVPDQLSLLQQLIDCGTTRVLTSGGCETAWEGREQIARLRDASSKQIEILPGSGISSGNAAPLVRSTGCDQLHGSFSQLRDDPACCPGDQKTFPVTCQHLVAATREALDAQIIDRRE